MYKKLAIVGLFGVAALVAGCAKAPMETVSTENPQIPYSVLFNRHGCEIGRFEDQGRSIYVTICPGGESAAQWQQSSGKTSYTVRTMQDSIVAPVAP